MELLPIIIFGLTVGFLGGYAGIAGAPILVSLLVIFGILDQHTAQGTVLAAMLGPMSALSVWHLRSEVKKHIKIIVIGVLSYAFFSYFGAQIAFLFDDFTMQAIFTSLLLFLAINQIFNDEIGLFDRFDLNLGNASILILASLVGFIGGMMGIGAGVLLMPILLYLFKFSADEARAISLAILLPPVSIGGVYVYYIESSINIEYAIILFLAYVVFNGLGSKVASSHKMEKFEKNLGFIYLLLVIAYSINIYIKYLR